jgi:transcriptional regulator with XRE-family HTH domain
VDAALPMLRSCLLGQEFAKARIRAGVSISMVADKLDVSACDVMELEMGLKPLSPELVEMLCDVLGLDPSNVLKHVAQLPPLGARGLLIDLRLIAEISWHGRDWQGAMVRWAMLILARGDAPSFVLSEARIDEFVLTWVVPKVLLIGILRDFVPLKGARADD